MTYDPLVYWRARGEEYEASFNAPAYVEQERTLAAFLAGLDFASVLDVGCGFGRVGRLVAPMGAYPYSGIDLSPTLLESARGLVPDGQFVETSLADFDDFGRRWDLVVAVEFLMHVPPEQIVGTVRKLTRLSSRHVVTLDWAVPVNRRISAHNFLHDYPALLGDAGFGRTRHVEVIDIGPLQRLYHIEKAAR